MKPYFLDVISTVGPKGEKSDELYLAYTNCLQKMKEENLRTIAFPCISTGIYGYPNKAACEVALEAVRNFLEKNEKDVDLVIFCVYDKKDLVIYKQLIRSFFDWINILQYNQI